MPLIRFMFRLGIVVGFVSPTIAGFAIDLDYAAFQGDDQRSYVEIYAAIQRDVLFYQNIGDTLRQADFELRLTLTIAGDTAVVDTFAGSDRLGPDENPTAGQFFPFVFQYLMKPGMYELRAALFQYDPDPRDVVKRSIRVRDFAADSLTLSDAELGCSLERAKEASSLTKNGIKLVPNPTAFYGTQLPMLYFYIEAYGLRWDSTATDSLAFHRAVYHAESNKLARPVAERVYAKSGPSAVLADGFPVYTLTSGTYRLEFRVVDLTTGLVASQAKRFFCYRPDDFLAGRPVELDAEMQTRLLETDPDILEIIDPDSALALMKYVLTTEQSKNVKSYTDEGKHNFLREFWKERELDDPGAANRYFARVAEANRRFGYMKKPGWNTDRGRVLVMYGEPDQISRRYQDPRLPDHEFWIYYGLHGGVDFVFLDRSGFGDLVLVHSTMPGEQYNPAWENYSPNTRYLLDSKYRY